MAAYLQKVGEGKLPVNHAIISQIQDIFNLLPNLNEEEVSWRAACGVRACWLACRNRG